MEESKKFDKKMAMVDGNEACATSSYYYTEAAYVFPITPATPMCVYVDEAKNRQEKNIFDEVPSFFPMHSEMGVGGAIDGAADVGLLTSTYTASQGLLLVIPSMYKIAGTLAACVIHVASRGVFTQAGTLQAHHHDVMACAKTGWAMLSSSSVQEAHDMAIVAHNATVLGHVPFMHFFDSMRTSHELNKIEVVTKEMAKELFDFDKFYEYRKFYECSNDKPFIRATAQGPQEFMQITESQNQYYEKLPGITEDFMDKFYAMTGRRYHCFTYYGCEKPKGVFILMGAGVGPCKEYVDLANKNGEEVGIVNVHLYRPWSTELFLKAIPESVKIVTVLDKYRDPGSQAEGLYMDVLMSMRTRNGVKVIGGRYGYSGKEFNVTHVHALHENMKKMDEAKDHFTIGINDDVGHHSIEMPAKSIVAEFPGRTECIFFGLASDGTIGANKESIKIIGSQEGIHGQGYFIFDAKKSGAFTVSHLRFGPGPLLCAYKILPRHAHYLGVHHPRFIFQYDIIQNLREGGNVVLNCEKEGLDALSEWMPSRVKRLLHDKKANFYTIDAWKLAKHLGMGGRINMIMQTIFFKLSGVLEFRKAIELLKQSIKKMYEKKGEDIVAKNIQLVDEALSKLVKIDIPSAWGECPMDPLPITFSGDAVADNVLEPLSKMKGDGIPVSAISKEQQHGMWPSGTTKFEKRGVAVTVPIWDGEKCIQCNRCSYVCPHAAIRPVAMKKGDEPDNVNFVKMRGVKKAQGEYVFRVQVSPLDCMGCYACVNICPKQCLTMHPVDEVIEKEKDNWENLAVKQDWIARDFFNKFSVKGSQFNRPYLEFSGACAGCCETPITKLLTQLFGNHLFIGNATGCSIIWAICAPSFSYSKDDKGRGPCFEATLFENAAEFGFGIATAAEYRREMLRQKVQKYIANQNAGNEKEAKLVDLFNQWLSDYVDPEKTLRIGSEIEAEAAAVVGAQNTPMPLLRSILENREYFQRKRTWIVGGDGWAYDIGSGGLDHALSSGANINVLILDTEVYSNTGGQRSKASPLGATATFSTVGKRTKKKELGLSVLLMMDEVYVAQVAQGANPEQLIKAIKEADEFEGPSVVIAYCPCIAHHIIGGMGIAQQQQARAVESGYWPLFRFNPALKKAGKNPLTIDSKIKIPLKDFIGREIRFTELERQNPELAKELHDELQRDCFEKDHRLKQLKEMHQPRDEDAKLKEYLQPQKS